MAEKEYDYCMKIKGLKNVNITALFSAPLNHLLISQEEVTKLFKTGDTQKDVLNFVQAPGLKVFIFPNQKKNISFEASRLIVNDMSETEVMKSPIIQDFEKVYDLNVVDKNKIVAYGFNYDVLAEMNGSKLTDLVGSKITKLPGINVKNAEVKFSFEKKELNYVISITPTGKEKEFMVHFNVQFNANNIPVDNLVEQMHTQYKELEDILEKL